MSDSDYFDIAVVCRIDTSDLISRLDDDTILGGWEQEGTLHLFWSVGDWAPEKMNDLKQLLLEMGESPDAFTITMSRCPSQDWNLQWAQQIRPIRIGQRIHIRPTWEIVDVSPGDIEIILDPKQAFGTGHHATTYLLIEWIEEVIKGGESVLDIGTGSGILALVAMKLGARFARGIDDDPIAIACAKEYARCNHSGKHLQFEVQGLEEVDSIAFDIILANLDRRTLMNNASRFANSGLSETRLYLSGLLREDQFDVSHKFGKLGWELFDVREREGWVALGLKRSPLNEASFGLSL